MRPRERSGLNDFSRINVIYGPNGTGKTSLSGALDGLRNAADGEGYKRLSVTIDEGGVAKTIKGVDNPLFDRIHVFSEHFVDRNHTFTPAVAEMAAVLTIGERAKDAEEKLEKLREQQTAKTRELGAASRAEEAANQAVEKAYGRVSQQVVDAASRAGGRYHSRSNFSAGVVKTAFGGNHKDWVELSDHDLQQRMGVINADKADGLSSPVLVVSVPEGIQERASTALGTTPMTIILDTLQAHPSAANWVDQGRHHHEGLDTCIFCGSPLTEERHSLIDQHFSDTVQNLQIELREISKVLVSIGTQVDGAVRDLPSKGLFLKDLRSRYDASTKSLVGELTALKKWATELDQRVQVKLENVLTAVDSEVTEPPIVIGEEFLKLRGEHNERVSKHDELVQVAAKAVELHYLKKAEDEVAEEQKRATEQRALSAKTGEELKEIGNQITALDEVDGDPTPSAKVLTEEVARLLGRNELKFTALDGKYMVTRDDEPAIGLSVGERSAISLVHFLEAVARFDASNGKPIVVIDDPVSSLDSEVFMGVSTYIWNEAIVKDHVEQLILLTHNFELFRQWDIQLEGLHRAGKDKKTGKKMSELYPFEFYELKSKSVTKDGRTRRSPVIAGWPPSKATRKKVRSTYHHSFIATVEKLKDLQVNDSMENRLDAQLLFPNVIRRMLETFLAFKHPEWVGDFTLAMHNSAELLRDAGYTGDADALRLRLTRYTHASSHGDIPTTDATVSPDEVKTAIEAVFDFMNLIDGPHFAGLCQVTGVDAADILPATPRTDDESMSAVEIKEGF